MVGAGSSKLKVFQRLALRTQSNVSDNIMNRLPRAFLAAESPALCRFVLEITGYCRFQDFLPHDDPEWGIPIVGGRLTGFFRGALPNVVVFGCLSRRRGCLPRVPSKSWQGGCFRYWPVGDSSFDIPVTWIRWCTPSFPPQSRTLIPGVWQKNCGGGSSILGGLQ